MPKQIKVRGLVSLSLLKPLSRILFERLSTYVPVRSSNSNGYEVGPPELQVQGNLHVRQPEARSALFVDNGLRNHSREQQSEKLEGFLKYCKSCPSYPEDNDVCWFLTLKKKKENRIRRRTDRFHLARTRS